MEQEHEEQEDQKLLPAQDVLPESLLIIPLYDRPMFPKMMGPIMVEDPRIQQMILQAQEKGLVIYLGLLLVKQTESGVSHAPQSIEDFHPIGVAAKVVQISPPTQEQPLQLVQFVAAAHPVVGAAALENVLAGLAEDHVVAATVRSSPRASGTAAGGSADAGCRKRYTSPERISRLKNSNWLK
mgnify:CR=1 FL=1